MTQIILTALVIFAADPGNEAYMNGRYAEAEKYFTEAIQNPVNEFNLAAVYRAQGRYAEAEALYRKAIAHDPSRPAPLDGLALTCQSEGRLAEAEQLAVSALALETSSRTLNVLGLIFTY